MKDKLKAFLKLSRFNEYVYFTVITTFLGIIAAGGEPGWEMIVVLIANYLAVGFAFMINDIEDAPDDALNPDKIDRNPVSAGTISRKEANTVTYLIALLGIIAFGFLGWRAFIVGVISILVGFLYSWKGIRLKTMFLLDIVSHCMLLAGFQFLAGYFAFQDAFNDVWMYPFSFVVLFSVYGQLFNEVRDLDGDIKAGLRHTAAILGRNVSNVLMMAAFAAALIAGYFAIIVERMIDLKLLIGLGILGIIFSIPAIVKLRKGSLTDVQEPFHKPFEAAAAIILVVYFFI